MSYILSEHQALHKVCYPYLFKQRGETEGVHNHFRLNAYSHILSGGILIIRCTYLCDSKTAKFWAKLLRKCRRRTSVKFWKRYDVIACEIIPTVRYFNQKRIPVEAHVCKVPGKILFRSKTTLDLRPQGGWSYRISPVVSWLVGYQFSP